MTEENNNTAETLVGQPEPSSIITITTSLGDEDEDIHRCGRCGEEFSSLDTFIQHKLNRNCKRSLQESQIKVTDDGEPSDDAERSITDGGRKNHSESEDGDSTKLVLKLNEDGRYVCHTCEKTFKTANILRTHLFTHTDRKDFKCDQCGAEFRTKGSLIRHNRRHTDERPYRCYQCGLSFRESGALTRHLKSLTPCTEKIRYSQCKEILISKDGIRTVPQPSAASQKEQQLPVVSVLETVQDAIHIQVVETLGEVHQVISQPEDETVVEEDSLICQAIINSGIALETEAAQAAEQAEAQLPKGVLQSPEADGRVTEIQVTEECVEVEAESVESIDDPETSPSRSHKCPHCERTFRIASHLCVHIKGHTGYKPFKCLTCEKEFLTGYLLKKHMEVHVTERRYKCGECGKLFKAIGHVREHMKAHSDERSHHCNLCDKSYKTKNALQVHHRTHGKDKPYVCPHCSRGFREKGALVRHIRHHTGEKPFKCSKCGRGFAEHGTLNRHLRSKGGCISLQENELEQEAESPPGSDEQQECADSVAAALISEDPHAVLVEFSSVVADTQEYIIGTSAEVATTGDEVSVIQHNQNQMDSQILKVVQQVVSQVHGGQQIIVRNIEADEKPGVFDSGDTITVATPESLTEQVAMTLASAISEGTILSTTTADGTTTVELMEQDEQYVIASSDEMEVQTVVVV
ncbi:transcription factor E4F1 [Trichomycterus rosablanca]|uniref:transcription factor E4F1 n=1 Tax=Trichomycterus rosablanca TaxID=2290929 RepID=UPI002F351696